MRFRFVFMCVLLVLALTATYAVAAPIHDAAAKGDMAKVKALLKANPKLVNLAGKDDATPLHYAVAGGHKAVVEFLLASSADVNAHKKDGVTPLHVAAAKQVAEIGTLLLARGADVAARDQKGRTPISLGLAGWPAYMRNVKLPPGMRIRISPKDTIPQVLAPGGTFTMGSDKGKQDEKPVRKITVSPFWMDMHEVTVRQYCLFLNDVKPDDAKRREWLSLDGEPQAQFNTGFAYGPKIKLAGGQYVSDSAFDSYPVAWVSWEGADAYAKWAGRSLPTEAQWERAARAGVDGQTYQWGEGTPPPGSGNFCDMSFKRTWPKLSAIEGYDDGFSTASPVCSFAPNAFAIFDLAGNLYEWCLDYYDPTWYERMPERDPVNLTAPAEPAARVRRGSDWGTCLVGLQLARRVAGSGGPQPLWDNIGFRCASPE